jgi:hypothetical protein
MGGTGCRSRTAFGSIPQDAVDPVVHFANVRQAGAVTIGRITIGGRTISGFGLDPLRGSVARTLPKDDCRRRATKLCSARGRCGGRTPMSAAMSTRK